MTKQIIAYGKLIYNLDAEYEVINKNEAINISSILKQIYYSNNNVVNINVFVGCKILFSEEGYLIKKKDEYGIYDYHINGANLGLVLFDNTDEFINFEIIADADSLILGNGEMAYGQTICESKQWIK